MTHNLLRPALVSGAAEAGALYVALKARSPGGAFLTAHELIVQLQHSGSYRICRELLDRILEAPGDAVDRANWRLCVFRIEQALGLEHHSVTAAANRAKDRGPDHWASYIRDIRQTATAEG